MKVKNAATMHIESIQAGSSVHDAAQKMRSTNVGLLVVADGSNLVGVVTDRDIVTRCVALGISDRMTSVRSIISNPVVCVPSDAELFLAAKLMSDHRIRRLVVLDEFNVPAGVLSVDDLAFYTHGDETAGLALQHAAHSLSS